jgi:DNA-binding transcriptional LysR family regulator
MKNRADFGATLDWDKIRIFYTVAEAGSFTRAGDDLGLSQSAVSRQISALERELRAPLFHRHARGLILTEQGDLLFRAARDMRMRLETTRARLTDTSERPSGDLKVTTTVGLGSLWLTQRISEFLDLYPDVRVELILTNEELDLAMREADVAIRLRQPTQPDLIQRRLFTVHFHAYASQDYIKRFGEPKSLEDLDNHRILSFGGDQPSYLLAVHWLATAGRDIRSPRNHHFIVNDITALKAAVETGVGIAVLPDYAVDSNNVLTQVLRDVDMPSLDSYLVYAEEMRSVARVQVFRDFLVAKAQRWTY